MPRPGGGPKPGGGWSETGRTPWSETGRDSLVNVIDEVEDFTFPSYIYTPRGTSPLSLFGEYNHKIALSRGCTGAFGFGNTGDGGTNPAFQDRVLRGCGSLQHPKGHEAVRL